MQDKLQELTEKLYAEGLEKGRDEGEKILAEAKEKAEKIIADAQKEAEKIRIDAQKEAEDLKIKTTADLKMAATQSLAVTRQSIENLIITRSLNQTVTDALHDTGLLKDVIRTIAAAFNPQNAQPVALEFVLPEAMKTQLQDFIAREIDTQFHTETKVSYSKKMAAGFSVAPQGQGFTLHFTDEEFQQLLATYLRPSTKKILFGE